MKNTLLSLALILSSVSAFAGNSPSPLFKSIVQEGFAPPDYAGTFTVLVEADGTIRYIDNKNKQLVVAKLSAPSVQQLRSKIEAVADGVLSKSDEPGCADAPSIRYSVFKASGQEIIISEQVDCQTSRLPLAYDLNQIGDNVVGLVNSLKPQRQ